jgi:hypothetical protein
MEEILDHDKKEAPPKKNRYAILSFVFGLTTSNLLILLWNKTPLVLSVEADMPDPMTSLTIAIGISGLLGLFCSIVSIKRKENWGFYKLTGLLINAGLVIFIMGALIFTKLILW